MPVNGRRTRPNKPNNAKIDQTKRLAIASCSGVSLRVVIMSAVLLDKGEQYYEIFPSPPPPPLDLLIGGYPIFHKGIAGRS